MSIQEHRSAILKIALVWSGAGVIIMLVILAHKWDRSLTEAQCLPRFEEARAAGFSDEVAFRFMWFDDWGDKQAHVDQTLQTCQAHWETLDVSAFFQSRANTFETRVGKVEAAIRLEAFGESQWVNLDQVAIHEPRQRLLLHFKPYYALCLTHEHYTYCAFLPTQQAAHALRDHLISLKVDR